ncbi:hypothetical protein TL16_g05841 [Triparma laevis f. inornata]|uniref:Cytokinin riboside 5'-monophosphate phosphoribohydrolase n=1 Tax=Triparma laevis f. inornata TaxID=1714386 RepID=A0A9W7EB29_9STRA|nr:hypothetical protein TL16_g05841 [Triparma laevis f. inornata]
MGKVLAERNHICVNGGGKNGCMGKMNDGCNDHGGIINAVIHEMFVLDGAEYLSAEGSSGRHSLIVTTGPNLKERKEKLVEGCDGIIVLPGGTGTFDELFEMVSEQTSSKFLIAAYDSMDGQAVPSKLVIAVSG